MKLLIDERLLEVPRGMEERMMEQGKAMLLEKYSALDMPAKLGLKIISRGVLALLEKRFGTAMRPGNGDPNLHIVAVFLGIVGEGLKHVTASISTDGNNAVTDCNLKITGQDEGGGSVAPDGDERLGKDNSSEAARRDSSTAVSDVEALHS